jgi:prepilin-type processing-associated H-X9-DG protein
MKTLWSVLFLTAALVGAATFGYLNTAGSAPVVTVSGRNPVRLSWPTNLPSFGLLTKTNASSDVPWTNFSAKPGIIGTNYVVTNTFTDSSRLFRLSNWPQQRCYSQLRQIGLAFRIWEGDNEERFPFHASTNQGGTKEFRAIGPDGFDTNTFRHLQVMSNELSIPLILVCPGDFSREGATNFASLGSANVTYQVRSGDAVTPRNPTEVLAVCPVDGNTLFCDGSVTNGVRY